MNKRYTNEEYAAYFKAVALTQDETGSTTAQQIIDTGLLPNRTVAGLSIMGRRFENVNNSSWFNGDCDYKNGMSAVADRMNELNDIMKENRVCVTYDTITESQIQIKEGSAHVNTTGNSTECDNDSSVNFKMDAVDTITLVTLKYVALALLDIASNKSKDLFQQMSTMTKNRPH